MRLLAISLLLAFGLIGCSSPKTSYYKLSSEPIPVMAEASHKVQVMVGPVSVPVRMDRPQLVVQSGDNAVEIFEYQRWAGSLKSDISRVIGASLARELGTPNVWNYSQSTQTNFDYQIFIDVQNLESHPGESVLVDVLWTIKPANDKSKVAEKNPSLNPGFKPKILMGRSLVREPIADTSIDALIAAQSRAFSKVGGEIAQSVRD